MNIVISPSKTQEIRLLNGYEMTQPRFETHALHLVEQIQKLPQVYMGQKMKIKDALLTTTYKHYQAFEHLASGHAICSYTGTVFKSLNLEAYDEASIDYMQRNLKILSALYGVLNPLDGIKPYRLDMKMNLLDEGLYRYWQPYMVGVFEDDFVVSLASSEYSKMVPKSCEILQLDFKEQVGEGYKMVGYHAKVARGKMLDALIARQIEDVEQIKTIAFDGYGFNQDISSERQWYFTRISK